GRLEELGGSKWPTDPFLRSMIGIGFNTLLEGVVDHQPDVIRHELEELRRRIADPASDAHGNYQRIAEVLGQMTAYELLRDLPHVRDRVERGEQFPDDPLAFVQRKLEIGKRIPTAADWGEKARERLREQSRKEA